MPNAARTPNHDTMTGPKNRPTVAVPNRWTAKSMVSTTSDNGSTNSSICGSTTVKPSNADITETAGVITESP